ncbi:MAG: 4Fe-4S binding protein, partial [Deltaproteobacteria bacterium]|nr:4Fe-4S binding protein [Candidatus Tharpellaceae bacterium]
LIGTVLPVFDPQKCISCGLCIAACPDNALRVTVIYDHEYENLAEPVQNLFRPLDLSKFTGYRDKPFPALGFAQIYRLPGCGFYGKLFQYQRYFPIL